MPVETRVELGDRAANDDRTLVTPHEQGVPCKQDLEKRLSARHVEGQPCLPALALALVKWCESRATSPEHVRDTEAQQPTRLDYIMIHARWIIERQSAKSLHRTSTAQSVSVSLLLPNTYAVRSLSFRVVGLARRKGEWI